jgi:hypothetical protein
VSLTAVHDRLVRLQGVCTRAFRKVARRPKEPVRSPHLSVNGVVDRRGLEPLTSAVQGRRSPS